MKVDASVPFFNTLNVMALDGIKCFVSSTKWLCCFVLNNSCDMHLLLIRFTRFDFHILSLHYALLLFVIMFSVVSVHMFNGGYHDQGFSETQN